jgi:hypothetical protein
MAVKASISVANLEAGEDALEKMIADLQSAGTATWPVEGDGGPNLILEIVNEDNDEFDPPSVEVKEAAG